MNILFIHYSQSGQLTQIMDRIKDGIAMKNEEVKIDFITYQPKKSFLFPWSKKGFYDAMPESVLNTGCEIEEIQYPSSQYDLIVFGYQPWFLSPSIPSMGILKNEKFKSISKGSKVITVIGARNMWISAQKEVKLKIEEAGGELVGNIPLIDKNNNLISAITIMHWMFTGKKTRKWNLFPTPGVHEKDILNANVYGEIIGQALENNQFNDLQSTFLQHGDIDIRWPILFIDGRAKKLFKIWAGIIQKKGTTPGKRKLWLNIFRAYLLFALFIVSPIVLFFYALVFRPFKLRKENEQKRVTLSV